MDVSQFYRIFNKKTNISLFFQSFSNDNIIDILIL